MTDEEIKWLEEKFIGVKQQIELTIKPICDDVQDHKETLYGNGGEGLKTKIDRVEQTLIGMKKSGARRAGFWIAAALAGLGGLINLIVGMISN